MGVLTQHGYDAAHLMGKFQGQKYAGDGLPLDACSDMFVYCEEASPYCTYIDFRMKLSFCFPVMGWYDYYCCDSQSGQRRGFFFGGGAQRDKDDGENHP